MLYTVANIVHKPDIRSVWLRHGSEFADKVFEQARPIEAWVFSGRPLEGCLGFISAEMLGRLASKDNRQE